MILHEDQKYKLFIKDDKVYMQIYVENINLYELREIIEEHPRITNLDFMKLRNASIILGEEPIEIANTRPLVDINMTPDFMKAVLKIYVTDNEFKENRKEINKEINNQLEILKITYGVKSAVFNEDYDHKKEIILAEGTFPQNGQDAEIKYIELPNVEPNIDQKGNTNFYDVELYKSVSIGDWIGEMIIATDGIDGRNIKNEVLHARGGKGSRLRYDSKTIQMIDDKEKQTLSAKTNGIVEFKDGKITIVNHLIIPQNVDYTTGNIDFKGYLTIKGIIEDGFSVIADYDITIQGELGLGKVKHIESRYGSIFIKGGVYGKNFTNIKAGKDIFIKHANQVNIECNGIVDIGFYIFDSLIQANALHVSSINGRIIGGKIIVNSRVKAQFIGNKKEVKTGIYILGFNRRSLNQELIETLKIYKEKLKLLEYNKKALNLIESGDVTTIPLDYKKLKMLINKLLYEVSKLEEKRSTINNQLKAKGEGSIEILGYAYPKTKLRIKDVEIELLESSRGIYYYDQNQIILEKR